MAHIILALAIFLCTMQANAQGFVTTTETLIPNDGELWWRFNTTNAHGIIYGAAEADGYHLSDSRTLAGVPENTMTFVDVPDWVPADVSAVSISGLLIITQGQLSQICNLVIHVDGREFGDGYIGQVVGNQRSGMSAVAPVTLSAEGRPQIGIKWNVIDTYYPVAWPSGCAYGAFFHVDAAFR